MKKLSSMKFLPGKTVLEDGTLDFNNKQKAASSPLAMLVLLRLGFVNVLVLVLSRLNLCCCSGLLNIQKVPNSNIFVGFHQCCFQKFMFVRSNSQLYRRLFKLEGVKGVFFGSDFITVTRVCSL